MNLNDLETFVLVAELGTFSAAADALGVPKSTVSRRVARLEEALGLALLHRSARSFALSDDGRALQARCAPALREIAEVERELGDSAAAPRGVLRATAPIDLGPSPYLSAVIAAYALRYPDVQVELVVSNRMVDLLDEGFDVAFRTHEGPLPDREDLVARRLHRLPIHLYASPAYLAERGAPEGVDALADHLTVGHARAGRDRGPSPDVTANDYGPVAAILAGGAGIGALPGFVAAPYVAGGTLVRLGLAWDVPCATLSLVWLRSRHLAPRVRAFIDVAVAHAVEG